ncbi:MAG: M28 family peptidase [Phycisphaerales bacterium JB038]
MPAHPTGAFLKVPRPAPRSLVLLLNASVLLCSIVALPGQAVADTEGVGSQHRYERPMHDQERFERLWGEEREAFETHVRTLANPFFEGRCPGTVGGDLAAEYLQFYFERIGLEPLFEQEIETPGGAASSRVVLSHLQPFELGQGRIEADAQQLTVFTQDSHAPLLQGEDFQALGVSGNGDAGGAVVFVGYGIAEGPEDYTSYPAETDLTGKVALMLRFEPMDADGNSLWAGENQDWSNRAALTRKLSTAVERGAAGILLVSPPHAADARAKALQEPNDTRVGRAYDIPILMITSDVANRLVTAGDAEGRDLLRLCEAVAEKGEVVPLEGVEVSIGASLHLEALTTSNVAALLPGRGGLKDEYLIIGGHYDHVGYGNFGARASNRGVIHVGADDNASGVAGTLVLAERLRRHYEELPEDQAMRSVIFLLFSGEEMGLLGSGHFVEEPPVSLERVMAVLNMDMIGAVENDILTVYGTGTAEEFEAVLTPHFEVSDLRVDGKASSSGRSDEASFQRRSIPGLHFFSGVHDRYHTPRDRAEYLNYDGAMQVVDLVGEIALDLAAREEMLTYRERRAARSSARRSEIKVRFGIAPGSYGADEGGVAVGQVFPGTTAARAGLKKGDRLIRWGGEDLPDIGRWMELLKAHQPGDEVTIVILRDNEEIEVGVVLEGRD